MTNGAGFQPTAVYMCVKRLLSLSYVLYVCRCVDASLCMCDAGELWLNAETDRSGF